MGSQDPHNPGTTMSIQSVAITSNVATLAVTILNGPIPVVNSATAVSLVSVQGTQTVTSGGAANFNITGKAVTGVSIDSSTGIGTITFALSSTNIVTTADSGTAYIPAVLVLETSPGAGQAFAINKPNMTGPTLVRAELLFSGAPGTFEVDIQEADSNTDTAFTTPAGAVITAVNGSNYASLDLQILGRFVRGNVIALGNSVKVNLRLTQL